MISICSNFWLLAVIPMQGPLSWLDYLEIWCSEILTKAGRDLPAQQILMFCKFSQSTCQNRDTYQIENSDRYSHPFLVAISELCMLCSGPTKSFWGALDELWLWHDLLTQEKSEKFRTNLLFTGHSKGTIFKRKWINSSKTSMLHHDSYRKPESMDTKLLEAR